MPTTQFLWKAHELVPVEGTIGGHQFRFTRSPFLEVLKTANDLGLDGQRLVEINETPALDRGEIMVTLRYEPVVRM